MVVSTRANERGSSLRDRTRVVPGWFTANNERGVTKPLSPTEADPMYRTDGTCAKESGPNAQKRSGAVQTQRAGPSPVYEFMESTSERDAVGPTPQAIRAPEIRGPPSDSAIAERGRRL